jgi:predicted DNA-binding antitoxin AbrB/MazE fold protein
MNIVDAVYRRGVFEPLQPVKLAEDQHVRLTIESPPVKAWQAWLQRVRERHAEFGKRNGVLPDSTPGIAEDRLR